MQIGEQFLIAHKQAIKAAWPFQFSYCGRKRSLPQGQEKRSRQRGQVVVEFILLIVVSVTMATYLSRKMVSRNPEEPGFLTGAWSELTNAIGADIIE